MQKHNQEMFKLTEMIFRLIVTRVANFPPFTGDDLERYSTAVNHLHPACNAYLVILQNDEVECTPADVIDLKDLIRRMMQAEFFNFLEVLEALCDYIVEKVDKAAKESEPELDNDGEEEATTSRGGHINPRANREENADTTEKTETEVTDVEVTEADVTEIEVTNEEGQSEPEDHNS